MNIAIIPARGGSKRIPHKNIKTFCGKPMIARSIEAAQKSQCFDRIIISTDDEEIAEISHALGAEIPFMRPAALSDDNTATIPVIQHAIEWIEAHDQQVSLVCCIYATAPFISAVALQDGHRLIQSNDYDYVFSATSYPFPIQRAIKIKADKRVEMFQPEHFSTRSQDLEEAYHDAGQFYWGTRDAWLAQKPIFSHASASVILPRHLVQDIDTQEDWLRAELMFKALNHDV